MTSWRKWVKSMRKAVFGFLVVVLLLAGVSGNVVRAEKVKDSQTTKEDRKSPVDDILNDIDYSEIEKVIQDVMMENDQIEFGNYVGRLARGEEGISAEKIGEEVLHAFLGEITTNKTVLIQLLAVAVLAAVFSNFANIFKNNQVSETSFYITYLLIFSILTSSFFLATKIASDVLGHLFSFMKVLLPTYMLSIAVSTGAKTSLFYYEATLGIFTIIDIVLLKIILPLINIYFVLTLANYISKEDMLSKLAELIEMIINWALKTLLAFVIGFNAIQGLIVPMADKVKRSAIIKGTSAIPGIGNVINSVSETVLGASVVVKNAIGVAGLVVIVTICVIPLAKIACFVLTYKFGSAIVQPISDKRIIGCMSSAANSAKLLLSSVAIALLLFMISIALIAASTNISV